MGFESLACRFIHAKVTRTGIYYSRRMELLVSSNDFDRKALSSLRSIDILKPGSCVRQTMRSRTASQGFAYGKLADADTVLSHCGTGGYDGTSAQSRPSITIQHQYTARLLPLHWQSGTRQARQGPSTLEGVAFPALRYINP